MSYFRPFQRSAGHRVTVLFLFSNATATESAEMLCSASSEIRGRNLDPLKRSGEESQVVRTTVVPKNAQTSMGGKGVTTGKVLRWAGTERPVSMYKIHNRKER